MIDKIAEAAGTAIEALRSTPVVLALVLFQLLLLGAVVWLAADRAKHDQARFEMVIRQCGPKT